MIGKRPLDSVFLAGTLFVGIFALRFLVGTLGDAITFLYVIPVVLTATLVWATFVAWRRSGASESASRRAAIIVGVDGAAWLYRLRP